MDAAMSATHQLPDYDPALKAYHVAFEPELEAAVRRYELGPAAHVLDCPCGDGFYAKLFARHMRNGTLVAADLSEAYLDHAKRTVGAAPAGLALQFVKADAYSLPFDDATFDLVWSAQSMISLDDPPRAIREMARVLRPGGWLAVLETDEYHHVLLPWPVGLELAIQKAIREVCQQRYGSGAKFAQSRKLRGHFLDAGLTPTRKQTVVADRVTPFGAEREFLLRHFEYLREFIKPELTDAELCEFDRFTSTDDPESFLNSPDGELTCLASICHATKVTNSARI
jgi:ubiquinone/menaquinone biosynthesis C-methylase UbiE